MNAIERIEKSQCFFYIIINLCLCILHFECLYESIAMNSRQLEEMNEI